MALAIVLEESAVEALPEDIKKEYTKNDTDGKFYLAVDGETATEKEAKKKLEEFRTNNIKLMKDIEQMKKDAEKFKDLDPKKYEEAIKKLNELSDKRLIDEGKIDELLSKKTDRMRKDYEAQIKTLTVSVEDGKKAFAGLQNKYASSMIDNKIQIAVNGLEEKTREGVMVDIIARGRRVFSLDDDGKPTARDAAGEPMFGKDGTKPLSIEEWVQELPKSAGHFFEGSKGSGGKGGAVGSGDKGGDLSAIKSPTERLKQIHRQKD